MIKQEIPELSYDPVGFFPNGIISPLPNVIKDSNTRMSNTASKLSIDELRDKILGVIYGCALGDAIGLATECMNKEWSAFHYDVPLQFENFIADNLRSNWFPGDWTDKTDQMFLVFENILQNNGNVNPVQFAENLALWVNEGFPELGDVTGFGCDSFTSNLTSQKDFKTDPQKAAKDIFATGTQTAWNGAVTRASILGIPNFEDIQKIIQNSRTISKTTHADPRCIASAVAISTTVALILQGKYDPFKEDDLNMLVEEVLSYAKNELENSPSEELERYIKKPSLAFLNLEDPNEMRYSYKGLGSGFYTLTSKSYDFKKNITELAMQGGDANANCAVGGGLLGLKIGYKKLPKDWLTGLIHSHWVNEKIRVLFSLVGIEEQAVAS